MSVILANNLWYQFWCFLYSSTYLFVCEGAGANVDPNPFNRFPTYSWWRRPRIHLWHRKTLNSMSFLTWLLFAAILPLPGFNIIYQLLEPPGKQLWSHLWAKLQHQEPKHGSDHRQAKTFLPTHGLFLPTLCPPKSALNPHCTELPFLAPASSLTQRSWLSCLIKTVVLHQRLTHQTSIPFFPNRLYCSHCSTCSNDPQERNTALLNTKPRSKHQTQIHGRGSPWSTARGRDQV